MNGVERRNSEPETRNTQYEEKEIIMTKSVAPQAAERFEPDCMSDRAIQGNGTDVPWEAHFFVQENDTAVLLDSRTLLPHSDGETEAVLWTMSQTMSVYNP